LAEQLDHDGFFLSRREGEEERRERIRGKREGDEGIREN
jgi:hypothetical protein